MKYLKLYRDMWVYAFKGEPIPQFIAILMLVVFHGLIVLMIAGVRAILATL